MSKPLPEAVQAHLDRLEAAGVPDLRAKFMFGGHSLFQGDVIFALVAYETLYLKVDKTNQELFEAHGSQPFIYEAKGKPMAMSYWECPPEILEDPEMLLEWCNLSYEISLKAKRKKR